MGKTIKCIIRQEWENRNAEGWIIERSGYVYVTNEDGTPHVYDSIKDARAEIRANFGRDANKSGILHSHSVDDYSGNVHDGYIFIVREDTDEFAAATADAKAEAAAAEMLEATEAEAVTIYATEPTETDTRELEERVEIIAAIEAEDLRKYIQTEAERYQWSPEETRESIAFYLASRAAKAAARALLDAYAETIGETIERSDPEAVAAYRVAHDEMHNRSHHATTNDREQVAYMVDVIARANTRPDLAKFEDMPFLDMTA